MKSPVFILSTGRTGTMFLAEALSSVGIDARHEPGPWWLRHLSNYVVGREGREPVAECLLQRVKREPTAEVYVEASCLIYGLARPLKARYPDAELVHLVRDPRSYATSALAWGVHRYGGRPLNALPYRRLAPTHIAATGLKDRLEWLVAPPLSRILWTWAVQNRAMREAVVSAGGYTVRYEDVFDKSRGYPGLAFLLDLAGVTCTDARISEIAARRVNPSRGRRSIPWTEWVIDDLALLLDLCAEEADHYGYDVSSEVRALLDERAV